MALTDPRRGDEPLGVVRIACRDELRRQRLCALLPPDWVAVDSPGAADADAVVVVGDVQSLRAEAAHRDPRERVIVLVDTGDSDPARAIEAAAAHDFLSEPLSAGALATRLSTQAGLARLKREAAVSAERERERLVLARLTRQKDALLRLTDELQRARRADEIHDAALRAILDALGCDRASVLLADDQGVLQFVAWRGLSDAYREALQGVSPWPGGVAEPAPIGLADATQAPLEPGLRQMILAEGIRAAAFIPLVSGGRVIGRFMAYFDEIHEFDADELSLSLTIARQLSFAIERLRGDEALRASEQRLRLATQGGKVGIWEWDVRSDRVIWTPSLYTMHGVDPATFELTVSSFQALIHPEDRKAVHEAVMGALEGRARCEVTFRVIRPDGSTVWLFGNADVVRENGVPVRMYGATTDISDIKRAEAAMRASEEMLQLADRRKDEFIAMLAHELRNPLAPIANAVQLLARTPAPDEIQARARAIIGRQTQRLSRLVDDLLDVSRITSGRVQLHRERIAVASVLDRAVETVRPLIEQQRHTLEVRACGEPLWVDGDATRLEQVVVNLLSNAAKYTEDGGRIGIECRREGGEAVIAVSDTGIGIDPELLPQVFELFTQAERTLDRSRGGLGIGLTLVQRLTQMHGGSVSATSAPGQGSTFTVRLPLLPEGLPDAAARADTTLPQPAAAPLRVLVVDDNVDAAQSLAMLLEAAGHRVTVRFDGIAAIAAAEEAPPEVAFLDIGLPRMDGYALARSLRALPALAATTLIAMTGYGQPEDRQRARDAGFHHHLVKPADYADVEALLRALAPSRDH